MAARTGWGRWVVTLAVILVAGGAMVWARAAAPRTAAGLPAQRTTAGLQRTTAAPLPQAPPGGTANGAAASAAATTGGATAGETGGAPGVVRDYFADLAAANYEAAYALLSPTWQAAHPYAAFAQQLPEAALQLLSVRIVSEANFHAAVAWTAKSPSGGTVGGTASLVNVRVGPTPPAGSPWRLEAPPAPASASSPG